jgi:hypothetical protein
MAPPDLSRAKWRKSSHSGHDGGECVEVAAVGGGLIAVRDSKNPAQPALTFNCTTWDTFINRIKSEA